LIDTAFVGHTFAPHTVPVEAGRVRQFTQAIGETRAHHVEDAAGREHGWPGVPVPPTMLFALEMDRPDPWAYLDTLGIDLAVVLHGEQEFIYHRPAWVGDTLTFQATIESIEAKRGGALELVTKSTTVTNQHGDHVADLRSVLAIRHEEPSP
jgi:acyl dehydratase